jgi:DNA processing protein
METTPSDETSSLAARYLRLHMADNVGPIVLGRLLEKFSTVDNVLSASAEALASVEGVGPARAKAILRARHDGEVAEEIARANDQGVRIICLEDPDYPAPLKHIPDPPICLYVRGRLEPADAVAVAIVGARRCSHYGCEQAQRFAATLAGVGFTVVSGLARGIDGYAHEGALAGGGRTLAVLGNGLARIYPPEHAALAERVVANGALISGLPMDAPPEANNFPPRNRIITGLCLGAVVVEAGRRSGALITARLTSEYNREVFAVPGRLDSATSVGTNAMIRDGQAKLITCLQDILDELGDVGRIMQQNAAGDGGDSAETPQQGAPPVRLTDPERLVFEAIADEPVRSDGIGRACGLNAGQVAAVLTSLQMKGLVRQLPGDLYVRRQQH